MIEVILEFATKSSATLSALSALGASVAALVAIFLSIYSLSVQRQHNRLSVRPIANFVYGDFEDEISIRLMNAGVGPMRIDAFTVKCSNTGNITNSLIEQMSDKQVVATWNAFSGNPCGKTIRAGGELALLKLTGDPEDAEFSAQRDTTRRALMAIELKVTFSDVYGKTIGTEATVLSWFGRHFFVYDFATGTLTRP
nr:hypothetical protein [Ruegeria sp. TM1040]